MRRKIVLRGIQNNRRNIELHGRSDSYEASIKGLIIEGIQANAVVRTYAVRFAPALGIRFDMTCNKHLRQRAAGNKTPVIIGREHRLLKEVSLPRDLPMVRKRRQRLCTLQWRRVEDSEAGQGLRFETQVSPVVLELFINHAVGLRYVLETRRDLRVYVLKVPHAHYD